MARRPVATWLCDIIDGPHSGASYVIDARPTSDVAVPVLSWGRNLATSCTAQIRIKLPLDCESSSYHGDVIVDKDGSVYIVDHGSTNGIKLLNGELANTTIRLKSAKFNGPDRVKAFDGLEVQSGKTKMRFTMTKCEPTPAPVSITKAAPIPLAVSKRPSPDLKARVLPGNVAARQPATAGGDLQAAPAVGSAAAPAALPGKSNAARADAVMLAAVEDGHRAPKRLFSGFDPLPPLTFPQPLPSAAASSSSAPARDRTAAAPKPKNGKYAAAGAVDVVDLSQLSEGGADVATQEESEQERRQGMANLMAWVGPGPQSAAHGSTHRGSSSSATGNHHQHHAAGRIGTSATAAECALCHVPAELIAAWRAYASTCATGTQGGGQPPTMAGFVHHLGAATATPAGVARGLAQLGGIAPSSARTNDNAGPAAAPASFANHRQRPTSASAAFNQPLERQEIRVPFPTSRVRDQLLSTGARIILSQDISMPASKHVSAVADDASDGAVVDVEMDVSANVRPGIARDSSSPSSAAAVAGPSAPADVAVPVPPSNLATAASSAAAARSTLSTSNQPSKLWQAAASEAALSLFSASKWRKDLMNGTVAAASSSSGAPSVVAGGAAAQAVVDAVAEEVDVRISSEGADAHAIAAGQREQHAGLLNPRAGEASPASNMPLLQSRAASVTSTAASPLPPFTSPEEQTAVQRNDPAWRDTIAHLRGLPNAQLQEGIHGIQNDLATTGAGKPMEQQVTLRFYLRIARGIIADRGNVTGTNTAAGSSGTASAGNNGDFASPRGGEAGGVSDSGLPAGSPAPHGGDDADDDIDDIANLLQQAQQEEDEEQQDDAMSTSHQFSHLDDGGAALRVDEEDNIAPDAGSIGDQGRSTVADSLRQAKLKSIADESIMMPMMVLSPPRGSPGSKSNTTIEPAAGVGSKRPLDENDEPAAAAQAPSPAAAAASTTWALKRHQGSSPSVHDATGATGGGNSALSTPQLASHLAGYGLRPGSKAYMQSALNELACFSPRPHAKYTFGGDVAASSAAVATRVSTGATSSSSAASAKNAAVAASASAIGGEHTPHAHQVTRNTNVDSSSSANYQLGVQQSLVLLFRHKTSLRQRALMYQPISVHELRALAASGGLHVPDTDIVMCARRAGVIVDDDEDEYEYGGGDGGLEVNG